MAVMAWQGWRMELPSRWNPLKLEGSYDEGYAAFADLLQQRLGVRWKKMGGPRFDVEQWAARTLREEVGRLAADEAKAVPAPEGGEWLMSRLYLEPEPPGRDLWVGYSAISQRAVVLSYQTRRRDRMLGGHLLRSLRDWPVDQPTPWAVFELSCLTPPGFRLLSHRLNAGDLSLLFGGPGKQEVVVRQIAVAQLALGRMPLDKWLLQQHRLQGKHYRSIGEAAETQVEVFDGRQLPGLMQQRHRRRRFFLNRWLAARFVSLALHDEARDRLVIVEATSEALARQLAGTVGGQEVADG